MLIGVNEVFETFQGEAFYTGTPSVFLRLQGCNVGCPWCDTKHTWTVNREDEVPVGQMIDKETDSPKFARMPVHKIADLVAGYSSRHVVITGGEPAYWPLGPLCEAIFGVGKSVQIETSGTEPLDVPEDAWVTVSPKLNMPGGKLIIPSTIKRADEIKMPVGKGRDVEILLDFLEEYQPQTDLVWLQPLSQNERATAICLAAAREHGWRVSVQTHKYLGVR